RQQRKVLISSPLSPLFTLCISQYHNQFLDLKSYDSKGPCGFKSRLRHVKSSIYGFLGNAIRAGRELTVPIFCRKCGNTASGFTKIFFTDDVVAVEDRARLMTTDAHGDDFSNARADHT